MKTSSIALIIGSLIAGGLLLVTLVLGGYTLSLYNSEGTLHNLYDAKIKANSAIFDNTWKEISQTAQVPEAQKAALKDIFTSYATARTTGGAQDGSLMKWVTESVPNTGNLGDTYRNLQNIITGARDTWTANQVALVDIARQYNLPFNTFPANVILKVLGLTVIDAKVITSTRTEKAFDSGKDDDVTLIPTAAPAK